MDKIIFADLKPRIITAIDERLRLVPVTGEQGFTLVEGFIMQPLSKEISGSLVIGGPAIPLVSIVGNTSGRIYYFALKALLPDLPL